MTKLSVLILSFLSFTLFWGCSSVKEESAPTQIETVPEISVLSKQYISDTIALGKDSITSVSYDITIGEGKYYSFNFKNIGGTHISHAVLENTNTHKIDTIMSSDARTFFENVFQQSQGLYTLTIHLQPINPVNTSLLIPTFATVQFKEFTNITPQGTWILTNLTISSLGETERQFYSVDDANYAITIIDDTCKMYSPLFSESPNMYSYYSKTNELNEMNYKQLNDTLQFFYDNSHVKKELTFHKYYGEIDDITFRYREKSAPAEIIETWYKSYHKSIYAFPNFAAPDTIIEDYHSSIDESDEIIVVTTDSVYSYTRSYGSMGLTPVSTSTNRDQWLFNAEYLSNSMRYRKVEENSYEESVYTKYSGSVPPISWKMVPETDLIKSFNTTSKIIHDSTGLRNALVYKLPLYTDSTYTFTYDHNFSVNLYNPQKEFIQQFPSTIGHNTTNNIITENGYYYLVIKKYDDKYVASTVDKSVVYTVPDTFSISYDNY